MSGGSRRGSVSPNGGGRLSRRGSLGEVSPGSRRASLDARRNSADPALLRRDSIEARRAKRTIKINETEFDYLPVRFTTSNNKYNWRAAGLKTNIRSKIFVHHRSELELEHSEIFQLALKDEEAKAAEKEKQELLEKLTLEARISKMKKERRDSLSPEEIQKSLSPRERGASLSPTVSRRSRWKSTIEDG